MLFRTVVRRGLDEQAEAVVVGWGLGDPEDGAEAALRMMGDLIAGNQEVVEGDAGIAAAVLGDGRWGWRARLRGIDGGREFRGHGEGDEAGNPRGMDIGGDGAEEAARGPGRGEREFDVILGGRLALEFESDHAQRRGDFGDGAQGVADARVPSSRIPALRPVPLMAASRKSPEGPRKPICMPVKASTVEAGET